MLLFGHTGITLGIALILRQPFSGSLPPPDGTRRGSEQPASQSGVRARPRSAVRILARINGLARRLDVRVVIIVSLLPDIIDKPLGRFFFKETLGNGRTIAHTLLFLILIASLAIYIYRYRGTTWFLAATFGTFNHLIFDRMWLNLQTLFWPLYGFVFERADITDYIGYLWNALLTEPAVYIPEIIGAVILAGFAIVLLRQRKAVQFLRHGQF